MRESSVLKRITDSLQKRWRSGEPVWWFKSHGGPMQRAGVPDLIVCYAGRFIAVEVKRPGEQPTSLQSATMQRISEAGGVSGVATSVDELDDLIAGAKR